MTGTHRSRPVDNELAVFDPAIENFESDNDSTRLQNLLVIAVGRANRANDRSLDLNIPEDDRKFHAGQREAHLQTIALIMDTDVKPIRRLVLGSRF